MLPLVAEQGNKPDLRSLSLDELRTLVDQLRDKIGSGVVVLGSASNGNVALIVGVTKDLTGRVQAGKVIGPAEWDGPVNETLVRRLLDER